MNLKNKKILIIAPHPDDEVICSGGLIVRAKSEKASVSVLFMAIGKSRQLISGETNEKIRINEIKEVSKFCKYSYRIQFVGDEFLRLDSIPQKKIIDAVEDEIDKIKPDLVVIPNGASFDQDHRATFTACITALRPLPKNLRHFVPLVLECEEPYVWSLGEFKPNFYIQLNRADLKFKFDALKLHKTQLRKDPFPRSIENLTRLAEMRGKEIGDDLAEAYRCHRVVL